MTDDWRKREDKIIRSHKWPPRKELVLFRGKQQTQLICNGNGLWIFRKLIKATGRGKEIFARGFLHPDTRETCFQTECEKLRLEGWGEPGTVRQPPNLDDPVTKTVVLTTERLAASWAREWSVLRKAEADPELLFHNGAHFEKPGKRSAWKLSPKRAVIVEGDLTIDGVLEIPEQGRLIVMGKLKCSSIVSCGSLYVLKDLTVSKIFYCVDERFETRIFGKAKIATLLCNRNHQYFERGRRPGTSAAKLSLFDEREGYAAIRDHLRSLAIRQVTTTAIAAALKRGK
jgi:hypothetical protein